MNSLTVNNVPEASDWTQGGQQAVFQQCKACGNTWYFHRSFCPACGYDAPVTISSTGLGKVHASTLVYRAPSDEFRAAAPYRIVLVDVTEGFRMMGHGDLSLAIGDSVLFRLRNIADRLIPYFDKEPQ
jgi:uncharacterized OB-fold protein